MTFDLFEIACAIGIGIGLGMIICALVVCRRNRSTYHDMSTPKPQPQMVAKLTTAQRKYMERERALSRLRKEKKRLDWLEDNAAYVRFVSEDDGAPPVAQVFVPNATGDGWDVVGTGDDYREAIDDARGQIARLAEEDTPPKPQPEASPGIGKVPVRN